MKAKEFDRIANKLELKTRDTHHLLAWMEHDGHVVVKTRRSHGSGDLIATNSIRQQLKLNEDQFRKMVKCTLSRIDYIDILRQKGII